MNRQGFPPMGTPHQQFFPPMGGLGGPMPGMGGMPFPGGAAMPSPTTPAGGAKAHAGPAHAPPAAGPVTVSMSRLNFKPQETALYDRLFSECDSIGTGSLPGSAVKALFRKSQLNNQVLGVIWTLSDSNKKKALNKEDFYIACRLIALAQNHLPVTEAGLKQFVDVPLPIFDSSANLPTAPMTPQASAGQLHQPHPQQPSAANSFSNFGNMPAPSVSPQPSLQPSQQQQQQQPPQQKPFADTNSLGFDSGLGGLSNSNSMNGPTPTHNAPNSMGFGGLPPMNNNQQFGGPNAMQMPNMQMQMQQPEVSQAQIDEFKNVQGQLEHSRKDLDEKQRELKYMREVLEAGPHAIAAMKKEIQDLETQAAVAESQMNQMRAQFKGIEDMKNTQYSILQTRKDQAARLLRERAEVQELLDAAKAELERIKYEAGVMKESLPQIQEEIIEMRAGLHELRGIVEEERKNPSKQSGNMVKVGADGKVQLNSGTAPAASTAPVKSRQPSLARAPSVFDDDEDYRIDDVNIPTDINVPVKPASAAAASSDPFGSFGDDGFGSSAPVAAKASNDDGFGSFDDGFGGSSTPQKSTSNGGFGSFGDDDFGSSTPPKSAPSADAFGEAGDFSDPFSGPAAVDPFAPTSPTASAPTSNAPTKASKAAADPFGGFDDDFSSSTPAATGSRTPNGKGFDSFGEDPFAAATPAAPPKNSLFDEFESGFGSRSSKPAPPPSMPATPTAAAAPSIPPPSKPAPPSPAAVQPPPPPPSMPAPVPPPSMPAPPVPASAPAPPTSATSPAAKKLAAFDDEGWDIPDVPGLGGDGFASGAPQENWNDPGNSEWGF